MNRPIMFDDALTNILASSVEVATGAAVAYLIYSIFRDVKDAFLR